MEKSILEAMKANAELDLNSFQYEVISVETVTKKTEQGEIMETKLNLEIPRGCGNYSRKRLSVKVPKTSKFDSVDFDEQEIFLQLENVKITFIDKGNVYFRADGFTVV